jgi:hypothetical protein
MKMTTDLSALDKLNAAVAFSPKKMRQLRIKSLVHCGQE